MFGEFQEGCHNVMMKRPIRKNTFFVGQSNAGKSVLMRSLRDGWCEFGSMMKSDTFAFQDCVDRQVVVNEEMLIDPKNVDRFKQLAEGSDVKVDVQMKEPVIVRRTPIIVCYNTILWNWCPTEKKALMNRMY
jgi:GTPase SAR1 family protein